MTQNCCLTTIIIPCRLDKAIERVLRVETELCSVKQQNALLERQLGRMGAGRVTCLDGKQHDQLLVRYTGHNNIHVCKKINNIFIVH